MNEEFHPNYGPVQISPNARASYVGGITSGEERKPLDTIHGALRNQNEAIGYLIKLVTQLEKRLVSVMDPKDPGVQGHESPLPHPESSNVLRQIQSHSEIIRILNAKLTTLSNRLEL